MKAVASSLQPWARAWLPGAQCVVGAWFAFVLCTLGGGQLSSVVLFLLPFIFPAVHPLHLPSRELCYLGRGS